MCLSTVVRSCLPRPGATAALSCRSPARSHWQVAVSVPQDLPRPGQRPGRLRVGCSLSSYARSAGSGPRPAARCGPRPAARSGPRPAVAGSESLRLTIPPFPPGSARARTHQQTTTAEATAREKRNGKRHERMTREKREIGPDTEEQIDRSEDTKRTRARGTEITAGMGHHQHHHHHHGVRGRVDSTSCQETRAGRSDRDAGGATRRRPAPIRGSRLAGRGPGGAPAGTGTGLRAGSCFAQVPATPAGRSLTRKRRLARAQRQFEGAAVRSPLGVQVAARPAGPFSRPPDQQR
jgi:hypothetical protein